jgi:N-glycosylase/DNA lyase
MKQIAVRDYHWKSKIRKTRSTTVTKEMYDEIADFFRNLWGDYAGWAHSVNSISIY